MASQLGQLTPIEQQLLASGSWTEDEILARRQKMMAYSSPKPEPAAAPAAPKPVEEKKPSYAGAFLDQVAGGISIGGRAAAVSQAENMYTGESMVDQLPILGSAMGAARWLAQKTDPEGFEQRKKNVTEQGKLKLQELAKEKQERTLANYKASESTLGDVGLDVAGNLGTNALPIVGFAGTLAATKNPVAAALVGRGLAVAPAMAAKGQAYMDLRLAGASPEEAEHYSNVKMGVELGSEMILPSGGVAKTIGKEVVKRIGTEAASEVLAEQGSQAADLGYAMASNTPEQQKRYQDQLPKTAYSNDPNARGFGKLGGGVIGEQVQAGAMGALFGKASSVTAPSDVRNAQAKESSDRISKLQRELELAEKTIIPTGDKAFDAGQIAGVEISAQVNLKDGFSKELDWVSKIPVKKTPEVAKKEADLQIGEYESATRAAKVELEDRINKQAELKATETDLAYLENKDIPNFSTASQKNGLTLTSKMEEALSRKGVQIDPEYDVQSPEKKAQLDKLIGKRDALLQRRNELKTELGLPKDPVVPKVSEVAKLAQTPQQDAEVTTSYEGLKPEGQMRVSIDNETSRIKTPQGNQAIVQKTSPKFFNNSANVEQEGGYGLQTQKLTSTQPKAEKASKASIDQLVARLDKASGETIADTVTQPAKGTGSVANPLLPEEKELGLALNSSTKEARSNFIKQATTGRELLKRAKIINTDQDPVVEDFINKLDQVADLDDLKIEYVDEDSIKEEGFAGGARGIYNGTEHKISLARSGMESGTILHELGHAATYRTIRAVREGRVTEPKAVKAVERLGHIAKQVHKKRDQFSPAVRSRLANVLADPESATDELITNAFTTPQVRAELKQIAVDGNKKTLWDEIKDIIKSLLGIDTSKQSNLLDIILEESNNIIDTTISERAKGRKVGPAQGSIEQPLRSTDNRTLSERLRELLDEEAKREAEWQARKKLGLDPVAVALQGPMSRRWDDIPAEPANKPKRRKDDIVADAMDVKEAPADINKGATPTRELLNKIFKPLQNNPESIKRAIEETEQAVAANLYEQSVLMNQIRGMLKTKNINPKVLEDALGRETKDGYERDLSGLKKQPELYDKFMEWDRLTRTNSVKVIKQYVKHNPNLTQEELNVLGKIVDNLGKYTFRQFELNIGQGVGDAYSEDVKKNKDKEGTVQAKKWEDAKRWLIENELVLPTNLDRLPMDKLESMYRHWKGSNADGLPREDVVRALESIRGRWASVVDQRAEQVLSEIMGWSGEEDSAIRTYYRGSKLDKTIITPRTNIPEELQELMGVIRDPIIRMISTPAMQTMFIHQAQMLNQIYEMGKGAYLFQADEIFDTKVYSEQLKGSGYGPLDGMYTTKAVKQALEDQLQIVKKLEGDWLKAVKKTGKVYRKFGVVPAKLGSVVLQPANFVFNFTGAPLSMMANGNFFGKGAGRTLANAKGFIKLDDVSEVNKLVSECLEEGVVDSAQIGEVQRDHLAEMFKQAFQLAKEHGGSFTGAQLKQAFNQKMWRPTINSYAFMDMYGKISNYLYEKEFWIDYHARNKTGVSEKQIRHDAAARIKDTNYTYQRAIPITKWADKWGIQMFSAYMISEVPRTLFNNMSAGIADVRRGTSEGDSKLVAHGVRRISGTLVATAGHAQVLKLVGMAYMAAGVGVKSVLDGGDDENDKIKAMRELMSDRDSAKILMPWKQLPGAVALIDVSRHDPHDPVNNLGRKVYGALSGTTDWDDAKGTLTEMFFPNTFTNNIVKTALSVGGYSKAANASQLKDSHPDTYKAGFDGLVASGVSPSTAKNLINIVDSLIPPILQQGEIAEKRQKDMGIDDPALKYAEAMGMKPVIFNPTKELNNAARFEYGTAINSAREVLREKLKVSVERSDRELIKMYVETADEEMEAFAKMQKKVQAAKTLGLSNAEIMAQLKDAGIPQAQIMGLMTNKFIPQMFGPTFLDDARNQAIKQVASREDKLKIYRNYELTKAKLVKIQQLDFIKRMNVEKDNRAD